MVPPSSASVQTALLTPLADLAAKCAAFRHCPTLPDEAWLVLGTMLSVATQNRPALATSKPATREGLRLKRR